MEPWLSTSIIITQISWLSGLASLRCHFFININIKVVIIIINFYACGRTFFLQMMFLWCKLNSSRFKTQISTHYNSAHAHTPLLMRCILLSSDLLCCRVKFQPLLILLNQHSLENTREFLGQNEFITSTKQKWSSSRLIDIYILDYI